MRMKVFRITYYTLMGLCLLMGRFTGRREFFLLFFVMLAVVAYAFGLIIWTIMSFSYVQEVSEKTAVKGQVLELHIRIHNDKPFPFTMMRVEVAGVSLREKTVLRFSLAEKDWVEFNLPLPCPYRGIYKVGMVRVEVSDIFGLVRLSYPLEKLAYYHRVELKVYPRIVAFSHLSSPARDAKYLVGKVRLAQDGDTYSGLRSWQPGDAAKRVHWKQSARKKELLVRQYERPGEAGLLLAIDNATPGVTGEGALIYGDMCCEAAAAIGMHSIKSGYGVAVMDGRERGGPIVASNIKEFQRISEYLALLPFEVGGDLLARIAQETEGKAESYRSVYVISSPDGLEGQLEKFQTVYGRRQAQWRCLLVAETEAQAARVAGRLSALGIDCMSVGYDSDIGAALGDWV